MAYATVSDVQAGMLRPMSSDEETVCSTYLDWAAIIIDAYNADAAADAKLVVSCRMVLRALGDGSEYGVPMGATQGTQSGLGYSQSWTMSGSGSAGELYLSKIEKKLLGAGDRIGAYSPLEAMVPEEST